MECACTHPCACRPAGATPHLPESGSSVCLAASLTALVWLADGQRPTQKGGARTRIMEKLKIKS